MEHYIATVASSERYAHAEGPVGDMAGRVLWVDIPNGDVYEAAISEHTLRSGMSHRYEVTDTRLFCHVDSTVGAVLLGGNSASRATCSPQLDELPEVVLAAGTRLLYRERAAASYAPPH